VQKVREGASNQWGASLELERSEGIADVIRVKSTTW
jgi:hypothetical protein